MPFEWDEAKSEACLHDRGFDFAFASYVFNDPNRIERQDARRKQREVRLQTIGEIAGLTYFVVYTRRGEAIRIISAREASEDEDKAYREGGPWN
jgi:uncharacterized DUF497 family protein